MNQHLSGKQETKKSYRKKEWLLRLLAIPSFAVFIVNATPLVSFINDSPIQIAFTYSYVTFISYLLWTGNTFLLRKLRKRNYWVKNPTLKIISFIAIPLVFSFLLSFPLFYNWNILISSVRFPVSTLLLASLFATVISIVVTILYEILILTIERRRNILQTEKLEHEKIQAELDTLKSQIDPHFFFNSLNTLAGLINDNKEKALHFNENLAKIYSYILVNRSNDLVTVNKEIEFINNYIFLLKIRFEDTLNIITAIEITDPERYYIPPIALQTGIENAIKHNRLSEKYPLSIVITITDDYAILSNDIRPLTYKAPSSGVGLFNLNNRYKLILNKSIHIDETQEKFTLYLPVIKKNE